MESIGIGRPSTNATTRSTIIDRGYENIEEKFRNLGAIIERIKE